MGNAHPSVFPYEPLPTADRDLIVAARQRPHLPQAVRRARHPRGARRPALRAQRRPHRQPGGAAADPRRAARHPRRGGVVRAARRRRGAVRADQHHRRRVRDGGEARARADRRGRGGRARAADGPAPDHVLRHARRLPAAAAGAGRARRRAAEVAGVVDERAELRDGAGRVDARHDHAAGPGPRRRTSWARSGSASWRSGWPPRSARRRGQTRVFEAVLAALADHGFTPTAIAARITWLSAPDSVQGALAAGLLGGGSRFLGVTEDTGRFLHDGAARPSCPTDDAGLGRARAGDRARAAGRGEVRARPRPPRPQGRRPAHPAADADRRGGGLPRPAPAALRRDRPRAPARCSAAPCR